MAKIGQQNSVLVHSITLVRCFAAFMVLVLPIQSGFADVVAGGSRVQRDVEATRSSVSMQRRDSEGVDKTKYTMMAVTGAAMVVVGTTVRFGEATVTLSNTSGRFVEKSYNGANYVLIAGGTVLFLFSLVRLVSDGARDKSPDWIGLSSGPTSTGVGYSIKF